MIATVEENAAGAASINLAGILGSVAVDGQILNPRVLQIVAADDGKNRRRDLT